MPKIGHPMMRIKNPTPNEIVPFKKVKGEQGKFTMKKA